jgi:hypothetical protein
MGAMDCFLTVRLFDSLRNKHRWLRTGEMYDSIRRLDWLHEGFANLEVTR